MTSSPLSHTNPRFAANVRRTMELLEEGTPPKSLEGIYSRIVIKAAQEEIERQANMKRDARDLYVVREEKYGRY